MKRLNFNIKDRKVLYGILTIALVCVFTLTIAYAALNAVLTISGNAQVTSANWDVHLANPKVTNGTGTTVKDNGVAAKLVSANGDINEIGTIVSIGDQQFYTIGTEGDNVKLLSMYNLYVGGEYNDGWTAYGDEATGKQDQNMVGWVSGQTIRKGTTTFSNIDSTYEGSIVEGYVNAYKTIIEEDYGVPVEEARLITKDELTSEDIGCSADKLTCTTSEHAWIYSTSYWPKSAYDASNVWRVYSNGTFSYGSYTYDHLVGVRPVIIISKSLF